MPHYRCWPRSNWHISALLAAIAWGAEARSNLATLRCKRKLSSYDSSRHQK